MREAVLSAGITTSLQVIYETQFRVQSDRGKGP